MNGTIFFDLDGTLTDPKTGITQSINYALTGLGFARQDNDELTWCIGPPLLESFEKLVGDTLATEALALFRERFSEVGWQENAIYPGIVATLQQLTEANQSLYVATSKPFVYAEKIIRHFKMDRYFLRIFGSELDGTRARKGELLRFALSEIEPVARATMIGDREHDIFGAKANRIRSVGVTYGYGSKNELQTAGADVIVNSPGELIRQFA